MTNNIPKNSQQEKILKTALQSRFSAEHVQKIFIDSLGPYLALQESARKSLEAQRPLFEAVARQANEMKKAFQSAGIIRSTETLIALSETQKRMKSFLIEKISPKLDLLLHSDDDNVLIPLPKATLPAPSAEEIAELVCQKLTAIAKSKDKSQDENPLVDVPKGASWENIEIRFNDDTEVSIYIDKKFYKTFSHDKLDFYDRKTNDKHPDKLWDFLLKLSVFYGKKLPFKPTVDKMQEALGVKNKDACTRIKSNLSKKLQQVFGINEEPFLLYKDRGYYQPRFTLKPVPLLRGNGEIFIAKTRYNDQLRHDKEDNKDEDQFC